MDVVYLDNAATSFPKPEATLEAMMRYQRTIGGSPGRSGHRLSIEAGRVVHETREVLARLFNIDDPLRIVFTKNATEALNIALIGLLKPGDHVITTGMEHNSVMRPLRYLASRGIDLSVVPCSERGELDPDDVSAAFRANTRAVVMTHASNVTGTIMPVKEVGALTRVRGDIVLCVDAAQTAGALPIDVATMSVDLLAFTGHKSLYGPQGTGGLYIRKGLEKDIAPFMRGGTGSRSEFEEQPDFMPDKYECGTPNTIGLAGLHAGAAFILEQGVEAVRAKESALTRRFMNHLQALGEFVTVYGPPAVHNRIPLISFNLRDITPSDAALYCDEQWGVMCRPGLHCAPAAHRIIGSFPQGTVRFSFGFFNTQEHVDLAAEALRQLLRR
ncbi:MAG: cysteine desulfurase [Syntrophus sp. (in: bacteria)]|nr:cysteine desulfurase [Syntrophus sp. (in: bacteria)]